MSDPIPMFETPVVSLAVFLRGVPTGESILYKLSVDKWEDSWAVYQDDIEDGEVWNSTPVIGAATREEAGLKLSAEWAKLTADPAVTVLQ